MPIIDHILSQISK